MNIFSRFTSGSFVNTLLEACQPPLSARKTRRTLESDALLHQKLRTASVALLAYHWGPHRSIIHWIRGELGLVFNHALISGGSFLKIQFPSRWKMLI
jgi:hypothetical protein